MASGGGSVPTPTPQFPTHNAPRVWLITAGDSPVGISLSRQILDHGDYVVSGINQSEFESDSPRSQQFKRFLSEVVRENGWKDRMKIIPLDISEAVVGTVEELSTSQQTLSLVRAQFEKNFFGPLNIIKAVIPEMRSKMNGHIIVLTGIHGHLGTPGLSMYCSAGWALEGICDSMAYEIAPFNIKLTIVQSSVEIGILTNKITSAPPMKEYARESGHTAPMFRGILDGLLNRLPGIRAQYPQSPGHEIHTPSSEAERESGPYLLSRNEVVSLYPPLSDAHTEKLLAETVHALTAIGGHENPPARHIVGWEGVASVKEKLKTVSEELEEFAETSASADIAKQGPSAGRPSNLANVEIGDVETDVFDASLGLRFG
ncbi:NAD(P)-binding protein, partial [Aureobasidium melanogenum]